MSDNLGMVGAFLDYYAGRQRFIKPIIDLVLANGFDYTLVNGKGKRRRLHADFSSFDDNRRSLTRALLSATADKGGLVDIAFEGQSLLHFDYHAQGMVNYLITGQGNDPEQVLGKLASQIIAMRERVQTFMEEELISNVTALVSGFLSGIPSGGYRLTFQVGGKTIFSGEWLGDRLAVKIHRIRPLFQLAVLLFQGVDFSKVRITTPLDFLRFFEKLRTGIRRIAGILSSEGHSFEAVGRGLTVLRIGKGVDPDPSPSFGNVEIRADNLFQLFTREEAT